MISQGGGTFPGGAQNSSASVDNPAETSKQKEFVTYASEAAALLKALFNVSEGASQQPGAVKSYTGTIVPINDVIQPLLEAGWLKVADREAVVNSAASFPAHAWPILHRLKDLSIERSKVLQKVGDILSEASELSIQVPDRFVDLAQAIPNTEAFRQFRSSFRELAEQVSAVRYLRQDPGLEVLVPQEELLALRALDQQLSVVAADKLRYELALVRLLPSIPSRLTDFNRDLHKLASAGSDVPSGTFFKPQDYVSMGHEIAESSKEIRERLLGLSSRSGPYEAELRQEISGMIAALQVSTEALGQAVSQMEHDRKTDRDYWDWASFRAF